MQSIDEKSFELGVFQANTFKNIRGEVIKMPIYLQKIFYMDCQDQTKKSIFRFSTLMRLMRIFLDSQSVTFFSILPRKVNFLEECVRDVRP